MKILSFNVNGLRSAVNKGLVPWLKALQADVICLQEIRIQDHQIPTEILALQDYQQYFFPAQKKGYSGVAIFSKIPVLASQQGLGWPCADQEGRYLSIELSQVNIASCYLPSGSSGPERQAHKFTFMQNFTPLLEQMAQSAKPYILCGDFNIAHSQIDLKNWRNNQKNSGFLPEERQWLSDVLAKYYLDAFRALYPEKIAYSWWSQRGNAYANDVGWRIDYQWIDPRLLPSLTELTMLRAIRFSDHAPVIGEYAL